MNVDCGFACVQASTDQERLKAAKNSIVGKLHSWACGAQRQHGEAMAWFQSFCIVLLAEPARARSPGEAIAGSTQEGTVCKPTTTMRHEVLHKPASCSCAVSTT